MNATEEKSSSNGAASTAIAPYSSKSPLLRPVAAPAQVIEAHKEAVQVIEQALEKDRDYGTIPGAGDRPTLLKPGAERLLTAFGIYADAEVLEQEIDHDAVNVYSFKKWVAEKNKPSQEECDRLKAAGLGRFRKTDKGGWEWQSAQTEMGESLGRYRYVVRTTLKLRSNGEVVGTGIGSCSSMESKYLRAPRDSENTILKMAKKRSLIDATLSTLGLSDRFTQDVEDMKHVIEAERGTQPEPEAAPAPKKSKLSPEVRTWLEGLALSANELNLCKAYAKEGDLSFQDLATEAHGEGIADKGDLVSYCIDASRMAIQRRKAAESPAPAPAPEKAEAVEAELVEEAAGRDIYDDDDEGPATAVIEGQVVDTETGEVKEPAEDPFFNGEYNLTPEQRRRIIGIVRGTGVTLEDVTTVGKAENATTIEELIKIAEREAGAAK